MRKSHEIPDMEWGQAPNLQEWIDKSMEERKAQQKNAFNTTKNIFSSLRPTNPDYLAEFNRAKGGTLQDIGVSDGVIWASMAHGDLLIDFVSKKMLIEPHEDGMVIGFHRFDNETLKDITSYIPSVAGLTSCIFAFACENKIFEYLIQPQGADTLLFTLKFIPHGEPHA